VIRVTGVQLTSATAAFSLQTRFSAGELRIAMAAATPLDSSAALLEISVRLIGAPGTASILDLAQVSLDEGARTVGTHDGIVRVLRQFKITGSVYFHDRVRPVSGVQLTATGSEAGTGGTSVTDADGGYLIDGLVPGEYTVTPARDSGDEGAIDALDVADILRFLVGSVELSAAQQLSADVSGNGRVGTTDATLILRYLVGLETGFPAGDLWQFDPSGVSISLTGDHLQNFRCYLLGDVNGDWGTTAPAGKRVSGVGPGLDVVAFSSPEDDAAGVTVVGWGLQAVRGGVMELRYDAEALAVGAVRAAEPGDGFLVAANTRTPGLVRIAFAGVDPVDGERPLVRVEMTPRTARSSGRIEIAAATLNTVALSPLALGSMEFPSGVCPTAVRAAQAAVPLETGLDPNYPNPFNSSTVLGYRIAGGQARVVSIAVYSLAGQRVRQLVETTRAPGVYRVSWDGRDDGGVPVASGVYLVRLEAGAGVDTRSVMYLK